MIDSETRQAERRWELVLLTCAVMLLLAACMPLNPSIDETGGGVNPATVAVTTSESSEIEVLATEGRTVLEVTSEAGIGNASVTWTAQHADPLLLRLRLNGLEEFRFAYGSTEVLASVSSSGDHPISQAVVTASGAQETINPASPYWLTIESKSSTGEPALFIPLADGYFEVTPSSDFVENPQDGFTFAWVDFYR